MMALTVAAPTFLALVAASVFTWSMVSAAAGAADVGAAVSAMVTGAAGSTVTSGVGAAVAAGVASAALEALGGWVTAHSIGAPAAVLTMPSWVSTATALLTAPTISGAKRVMLRLMFTKGSLLLNLK